MADKAGYNPSTKELIEWVMQSMTVVGRRVVALAESTSVHPADRTVFRSLAVKFAAYQLEIEKLAVNYDPEHVSGAKWPVKK